jgi:hypothetical protein
MCTCGALFFLLPESLQKRAGIHIIQELARDIVSVIRMPFKSLPPHTCKYGVMQVCMQCSEKSARQPGKSAQRAISGVQGSEEQSGSFQVRRHSCALCVQLYCCQVCQDALGEQQHTATVAVMTTCQQSCDARIPQP